MDEFFFSVFCLNPSVAAPPRPALSHGFLLASQTSTPRLTPPGSPPSYSATASPTKTSKPVSPRRHAMSFSTSRGMMDDRSSIFSSMPPSSYGSMTGSETGSHTGKLNIRFEVINAHNFHFINLILYCCLWSFQQELVSMGKSSSDKSGNSCW